MIVGTPSLSTAQPEKQPSSSGEPGVGARAIGRCVQCTRSVLVAWPHWILWWFVVVGAPGVVLVEHVIHPFPLDQAVGVVHPVGRRQEVIYRAVMIRSQETPLRLRHWVRLLIAGAIQCFAFMSVQRASPPLHNTCIFDGVGCQAPSNRPGACDVVQGALLPLYA